MSLIKKKENYLNKHRYQSFLLVGAGAIAALHSDLSSGTFINDAVQIAGQFAGGVVLKKVLKLEEYEGNTKNGFLVLGGLCMALYGYYLGSHLVAQLGTTGLIAGWLDNKNKLNKETESRKSSMKV